MSLSRIALVCLIGVLPVAFWPGSTSYDRLKFLLLTMFVATLPLDTAWSVWRRRPWPVPSPWAMLAMAGLLLVMAVSAINATNLALVARTALCVLGTFFVFAVAATADRPARLRFHVAAQIGGVLSGLYALTQWLGLLPGTTAHVIMAPGIGGFGNPNYVAGLAAVLFWPAVSLVLSAGTIRMRTLAATAATTHLLAMAISQAIGPPLAVAAAGLLLAPAALSRGPRPAGWITGLVLVAVTSGSLGLGLLACAPATGFQDQPLFAANSGSIRIANWRTALAMFDDNPLTGVGAGNYPVAWLMARADLDPPAEIEYVTIATRAHNEYLQWLAETGLAGGLWLAAVVLVTAWSWVRRVSDTADHRTRCEFLGLVAALVVVAVHAGVSFPVHLPATAVVVAFYIGILMPESRHEIPVVGTATRRLLPLILVAAAFVIVVGAVREFRADLAHEQGRRHLRAGDAWGARRLLHTATSCVLWPERAHLQLALAERHLGRNAEAETALRESLRQAPSFEAMQLLAEREIESGRFPEALARLERIERCSPPRPIVIEIRYLRGLAAIRQGHLALAQRQLEDLVAEAPHHARTHLGLGYIAVLTERHDDARKHYADAVAWIQWLLANSRDPDVAGLESLMAVARKALASVDGQSAGPGAR